MSTRRRILTAFAIFAVAFSLLAAAEAKKPAKVAVLDKPNSPVAEQQEARPPVRKEKPRAKKYLPVADFSDY